MTKAKAEKLVTRVIVGPKGIWIKGVLHPVGTTIRLPAKSAKAFSRYLESPNVARAKAAAFAAEEEAAAEGAEEEPEPEPEVEVEVEAEAEVETEEEGGDSPES